MKNILLIPILLLFIGSCNSNNSKQNNQQNAVVTFDTAALSLKSIDDLHNRLTLKNYDQSFTQFINSNPNKIDSTRKVIYLLPFGNMDPAIEKSLQDEKEYLEAFFQLEVKILDRISYESLKNLPLIETRLVPRSDFEYYSEMKGGTPNLTEQIQANSFINEVLKKNKPKDAIVVLGVTEHDIYNPKYNYLFGISDLKEGVGLVSTFRLIDYELQTKYNIRKVISKQIINMFSIPNVKDYKCVANYHNSISDLYEGEFALSPRALEKLKYAIGFDYTKRFNDLSQYWSKEKNAKEEKYYKECIQRMDKNKIL